MICGVPIEGTTKKIYCGNACHVKAYQQRKHEQRVRGGGLVTSRRGHGEGSIHPRQDGRWVAVIDLGWKDGKRQRKYLYAETRREADGGGCVNGRLASPAFDIAGCRVRGLERRRWGNVT